MTSASEQIRNLARRILAAEAARDAGGVPAAGAIRVCAELQGPLTTLAGTAGYSSLLARALSLTRDHFPSLAGVVVRPDGTLDGFAEGGDASESDLGQVALVSNLLALLSTFIGDSLTLRLACTAWPEAITDRPDPEREVKS